MAKRKDFPWLLLLVFIATILLAGLFNQGIYGSHDGEIHIARIAQFLEALKDGQFPVRWLESLNFGFGYPTFVYAYSSPYYLGSLISILIPNFEIIFKILMFTSIITSAITFYYFSKNNFTRVAAFMGSLFYTTAPYRFADIYERGALGEALSFVLIPLLFSASYVIIKKTFLGFIFTSLTVFAFITTHALTLLIFLPAQILFSILIFGRQIDKYKILALSIVFGFLLASFQWLPMIFEQKYIELDKTYFNIFQETFIGVNQLLRIPKDGTNIGTGIQLGLAQSGVILLSFGMSGYEFLAKRFLDKFTIFFLITGLTAALLTLDISKPIWFGLKPLATILFPWRFLTFTTFAAAILAGLLANRFVNHKCGFVIMLILIFIALYPARHYWQGRLWHTFSADYYASYQDPYKLDNYYLPKGLLANLQELQLEPISVIEGDGEITILSKQSNLTVAQVSSQEDAKIQFHTMYFPGWTLTIDDKKSDIIKDYPNLEGIIIAEVPKGSHTVTLEFMETTLRRSANFLSLFSFIILVMVVLARIYLGQSSKKVKQVL